MKTALFLLTTTTALLTGCIFPLNIIHGSGDTVLVTSAETGFSKVSVSHACDAVVTRGDSFSVVVEIDDNIEKHLAIENNNGELIVTLDHGYIYDNLTFKATITMPELESIDGRGASAIAVSGFESNVPLHVELSGASEMEADIVCGDLSVDLSGASETSFTGSAEDLTCEASGASSLDFRQFPCRDATLDLSGASDIRVNASGTISGTLSGASEVLYYGSPTLGSFNCSGASEVRKGG